MDKGMFISDNNTQSERWAIFEDDTISGWLYLTEPNEQRPVADCWLYNRITAPNHSEIHEFENGPPPASNEYAGPNALVSSIHDSKISFKWSPDGHSVALLVDDIPLGFIVANTKTGYSFNLIKDGPWGLVYDEDKFKKIFR